jgi:hypothetical protein
VDGEAEVEIEAALEAGCTALAAVRAIPGSQARIEAAGRLADHLRSMYEDAARIRHDEAVRIYEDEKLSLAQLANRVGISKARADQIVRAHRKGEEVQN